MTEHKIVFGDSRKMSQIADESIQLIVTSPPYWQLKDYGSDNQIGFNDSYEDYINNLNLVWQECYRVLSPGCRMCINIGDQFARSVYYGRYKVIPIRTEIIRFCETLGMDYMGAVIWQKSTTMNTSGGGSVMGSFPYPRNGILKMDYEFILLFKKLGTPPKPSPEQKRASEMTKEEWNLYFSSHWIFNGVRQQGHIAMFPEELPKRLIKMFSFVGETVLDPFAGSGTTNLAAKKLGRNSVGYEINRNYKEVIEEKLCNLQPMLFDEKYAVNFLDDNRDDYSFGTLPYIFKDPHRIDKKVDIKKLSFGSKIDGADKKRDDLFRVKNVLSPDRIELTNGLVIMLIGIKPNPDYSVDAIDFLVSMFKNKRVFIKYDSVKYDNKNNLLCYLYLENKTFINRHLLRTGYVDLDESIDFKYKKAFMEDKKNAKRMGS